MKTQMIFIFIVLVSPNVIGQPSEKIAKEKMRPFVHWVGRWQGESYTQMGSGAAKKSIVDEYLEYKLDSAVILVEGIGKSVESESGITNIVHHALATLSFDQKTYEYRFNTHLKDGRNTNALFTIQEDNQYQWGFDVPSGKIRYSIRIDMTKKTWEEIGEFSNDQGVTWRKFFEMKLTKI
jgi:hypothetical protein